MDPAINIMSICSGYGGLDLGVTMALPQCSTVCYVEREAFAAAILVARMEAGDMDPAPIWTDLTTFDGVAWRGCVDLIIAGIPCQPYSVAGKQRGERDERDLVSHFVRVVGEVMPSMVFVEEVPSFVGAWRSGAVPGFARTAWDGPQPAIRRGADGTANRVDRLRALGNGVVPQQAALAFRSLITQHLPQLID